MFRKFSSNVTALLALSLAVAGTRVASGQTETQTLGGKDVRVPLTWLSAMPTQIGQLGPGEFGRKLKLGGKNRFYEIHVPLGYDAARPTPLVFVFHSGGSYPGAVRYESRMAELADKNGFIVVFPGGSGTSKYYEDRLLIWNDGRLLRGGVASQVDDVAFVRAALSEVKGAFHIDPRRIYSAGYSNGAQFTYRLSKEMSTTFAAIATVAGQRPVTGDVIAPPTRPISVIQFSGALDVLSPYKGGVPAYDKEFQTRLLPVAEVVRSWATFNGCGDRPISTRTVGRGVEQRFAPGTEGADVVLWTLLDAGHTWPSGNVMPATAPLVGAVNRDLFAAEQMWNFFKAHPLPDKYVE